MTPTLEPYCLSVTPAWPFTYPKTAAPAIIVIAIARTLPTISETPRRAWFRNFKLEKRAFQVK